MRRADRTFVGEDRIGLLEAIDRCGSISAAAREVGISYKTAWDAVDAMNNAAETPLVRRSVGGVGGGGTMLTEEGTETVRLYRLLQAEHQRFIDRLEGRLGDVGRLYSLLRRVTMRVSARNVFLGKVKEVRKGAVSTEVTIGMKGGETLCSVITNESARVLGLKPEMEAYAFFKASAVILGKDLHNAKVSARNLCAGGVPDRARARERRSDGRPSGGECPDGHRHRGERESPPFGQWRPCLRSRQGVQRDPGPRRLTCS